MFKVTVCSIISVLLFAVSDSSLALSSTDPDNAETARESGASHESSQHTYHLATLPSTNRKRVDVMCIRFLSLIPKARLTPATEERTIYRLKANTFDRIEPAKKRKAELSRQCESPFVVKDDNGYSVIAGSQLTETSALAEQKRLAGKNITTTILELRLPLRQWQMKSTESFTVRDAVIMAGRLVKIGVITTLVPADN